MTDAVKVLAARLVLLAGVGALGACTSGTAPWMVSSVTLTGNPANCNTTTGFVAKGSATPGYLPEVEASWPFPNCAIAQVTIVPSGAAPTPANIFLDTIINDDSYPGPQRTWIADYQLPAPIPGGSPPPPQTFEIVALVAAVEYPTLKNGNAGFPLVLGNNVDVRALNCTVFPGAGPTGPNGSPMGMISC